MDMGLVSGLLGAQLERTQTLVAAKMMKMGAQAEQAVTQLLDSAQKSASSLANVASGIGTSLDISV